MTNAVASHVPTSLIEFRWHNLGDVRLDTEGNLVFPRAKPVPGIYRFTISPGGRRPAGYVGEAKSLSDRFSLYRSRGKNPSLPLSRKTTSRIADYLLRALAKGRTVRLDLLDKHITVCSGQVVVLDLADKASRCSVEQRLIAELCASDVKVLNRHGNPEWEARS